MHDALPEILLFLPLFALLICTLACDNEEQPAVSPPPTQASLLRRLGRGSRQSPRRCSSSAADTNLPQPDINGNHVMQYVKEIVAIGPRPPGSPGHVKLEEYIHSILKGDTVENDTFTAKTRRAPSR